MGLHIQAMLEIRGQIDRIMGTNRPELECHLTKATAALDEKTKEESELPNLCCNKYDENCYPRDVEVMQPVMEGIPPKHPALTPLMRGERVPQKLPVHIATKALRPCIPGHEGYNYST